MVLVVVVVLLLVLAAVAFRSANIGSPSSAPTGPITYSAEIIKIQSSGPRWGPITNTSFEGVQFLFCPEFSSPSTFYLQGTGAELTGARFAFLVVENNSTAFGSGSLLIPSVGVREWFSPDGVFGVAWLSTTGHTTTVQLSVADPLPAFFSENVTLNPIANFTQAPRTVAYLGVTFNLQGLGGGPGGTALNATATMPNGTAYPLSMLARLLFACGSTNGVPFWVPDHATCLARGSPDHDVAILWDGNLNVTLMVRSG
ncbi:MAG: hypothetical protein ACLP8Y_06850 [Thermoplasmata archaeon]